MAAPDETISRRFAARNEPTDVPAAAVAVLAVVASFLVGGSVYAAMQAGHTAIGLSFLAAVVLFGCSVGVFEAGRRLGAASD